MVARNTSRKQSKAQTVATAVSSRQRIHRAALERFARDGYDAVSLQQIADEVGLHKSSLFHHYSSKAVLLGAVLSEVITRVLEHVRPLQTGEPPNTEVMFDVFRALTDHFCDHPHAARLLLAVMTAPDDAELRRQAPDGAEFYAILAQYLERARRAGVVGQISIRQAIPNLMGMVLFYPAVAHHLVPLVGDDPFSPRARQARRQDLERAIRALLLIR
jgi:AcrR family transcriptional regulator